MSNARASKGDGRGAANVDYGFKGDCSAAGLREGQAGIDRDRIADDQRTAGRDIKDGIGSDGKRQIDLLRSGLHDHLCVASTGLHGQRSGAGETIGVGIIKIQDADRDRSRSVVENSMVGGNGAEKIRFGVDAIGDNAGRPIAFGVPVTRAINGPLRAQEAVGPRR